MNYRLQEVDALDADSLAKELAYRLTPTPAAFAAWNSAALLYQASIKQLPAMLMATAATLATKRRQPAPQPSHQEL